MLLTLLSQQTQQAGYRSYFCLYVAPMGGFSAAGTNPAVFASRFVVIGSGIY